MTRRILIVEDDAAISAMLADVLGDEGYLPTTAPTADAALGMLASVRPHLILCDLLLPGMDGIAFSQRLLRLPSPPPIVFMTVLNATEAESRIQGQIPACPILYKPIDIRRLRAVVDATMDRTT